MQPDIQTAALASLRTAMTANARMNVQQLAVALTFARAGFPLIPCCPRTKRPRVLLGFKAATINERRIMDWWQRWPDGLVGLPTSAFWVLDIDAKPSLAESMTALLDAARITRVALAAASALVIETPGGGRHLYFRRTPGVAVRTAAGDIAPGNDTRGHDERGKATGYIIALGCVLPNGRCYRILKGSVDALISDELPEAPRRLLYLAAFSKREREVIMTEPDVKAAIRVRPAILWRETFNAHQASKRPKARPLSGDGSDRLRRYAIAALNAEAEHLSSLADGRRNALFLAACKLARFSAHGVLAADAIKATLVQAFDANGGGSKHGRDYAAGVIHRGLAMGRNDALPMLAANSIGQGA